MSCPKCKSENICGLVQAFWIGIDEIGNPTERVGDVAESSTELGIERMCSDCQHEWTAGEE